MFETLNHHDKTATIIGGGIAGLLSAYSLVKKGFTIDLFEAEDRLGGLIQTHQTPFGLAETGANTMVATPQTLALLNDLGVKYLYAPTDISKGLIWRDGKAQRLPLKPLEIVIALFKAAFVKSDGQEKSFKTWTQIHLGDGVLDYLVDPASHGIYGTYPDMLEIPTAFKALFIPEGKTLLAHFWPQRKRPKRVLIAPVEGMQELIDRLEDYLYKSGRARIHKQWKLKEHPQTTNTIFCVPAYALGQYLPHLKEATDKIAYSSMVTATVYIKKSSLITPLPRTFGLLIPRKENSNILGIIFNSVLFPNRASNKDYECLTVMMKTMRDDDEAVKESIAVGLQRFLGIIQPPAFCLITRWNKAIPVYNENLRHFWDKANKELKRGDLIFGNYTGEVSLRGMIESALTP